jgi:indolepyruvate ferredoxin oxidoreductase beta subunit
MEGVALNKDPYSVIITGVGGQGNVLASRLLGSMLVNKGFSVTVGETFGAAQRGGSVMSHIRISRQSSWSPQIPKFGADMIAALEPVEGLRVLAQYGNPLCVLICNTHPVYPVNVIKGDDEYPPLENIRKLVESLTTHAFFIDMTDEARRLGNPILANMILLGALCGMENLPLGREDFEEAITQRVKADQATLNIRAFDAGVALLGK